ncbi:hypothetical protein HaLaN_13480 [Haematococcus lacustris]|uniref:Uncharacterized protein n=1 Tax=Haematococcus lacustris TaxID=44745 RepID=A0A699ZDJ3_HAELA|nr:hypothetical protein HaLaN_13480 [Haematococcus lacustris]
MPGRPQWPPCPQGCQGASARTCATSPPATANKPVWAGGVSTSELLWLQLCSAVVLVCMAATNPSGGVVQAK